MVVLRTASRALPALYFAGSVPVSFRARIVGISVAPGATEIPTSVAPHGIAARLRAPARCLAPQRALYASAREKTPTTVTR